MINLTIRDHWNHKNKLSWSFEKQPKVGDVFENDGVTYKITRIAFFRGKSPIVIVRMFKYKIANTQTTFVHKCPAKKSASDKLTRDDQIKLEKKHGEKNFANIMNSRVKMRSVGAQTQFTCPFCKTLFWKEHFELPNTVQVDKVFGKQYLKKRKM